MAATKSQPKKSTPKKRIHVMQSNTALATTATKFVATTPDPQAAGLTTAFVKKAQKVDVKITGTVERMGKDFIGLGILFREASDNGYHVALGFKTFTEYIEDRMTPLTGGKAMMGKSQVYEAMRVAKALIGGTEPKMTETEVRAMPTENAIGLSRMAEKGIPMTPTLIGQAKAMDIATFKTDVVYANLPQQQQREATTQGHHIPTGDQTKRRRMFLLSPAVDAQLARVAKMVAYVRREGTPESGISDDTLIEALCAEFEATYSHEYEEHLKAEEAEGINKALNADAAGHLEGDDDEVDEEDEEGNDFEDDEDDDDDEAVFLEEDEVFGDAPADDDSNIIDAEVE